jgi:Flp pilus assembly secretin CpaC
VAVRPAQDGQAEPGNLPQALPNAAAENTPPLPEEVADPKMSAKELENLTPYTNIPNPRPITGQIAELFELIQDPSVELSVVVGRGKVIQLREQPLRFILGNPRIATLSFPPSDVQSLAQLDRPSDARLFVVYGIQAGTTTLTIWDKNNVPTTFLVRVSVDTLDIQNQIRAVFPGTDVTVRQSANQIILEGQVPDTKTMNEVIRLVNGLLVSNQAGEVRAPTGAGGGGAGGQSVGAFAAAERALGDEAPSGISPQIINRLRVPGPRQILLKVKLAELNRTAIREIGANWLRGRNNSLIGSQIGGIAGFTTETNTQMTAAFAAPSFGRPGIAGGQPIPGSVTGSLIQGIDTLLNATAGSALQPSAQLFGIFRAGEFDLFLNALRTNNLATILAEPNLTALDGQPARVIALPVTSVGSRRGRGWGGHHDPVPALRRDPNLPAADSGGRLDSSGCRAGFQHAQPRFGYLDQRHGGSRLQHPLGPHGGPTPRRGDPGDRWVDPEEQPGGDEPDSSAGRRADCWSPVQPEPVRDAGDRTDRDRDPVPGRADG